MILMTVIQNYSTTNMTLKSIITSSFLLKRRAWQGSNLQSSDSQSDAFPLRHRPFLSFYHITLSLFYLTTIRCLPYLPISASIIGRFISSRIHPFPSEHGSKDAQSLFSTIMFTQMGTSGNLPFYFFFSFFLLLLSLSLLYYYHYYIHTT